jgi:predicted acyl esterase
MRMLCEARLSGTDHLTFTENLRNLEYFHEERMTRRIALLFFGASIVPAISLAQVRVDLSFTMSDSVLLDATIIKPSGSPPAGGFPGLVLVHGFGGTKDEMLPVCLLLASRGYEALAYSVRGQGNSGGLSTIVGDRERRDLLEIIQHFRSVPDVDPDHLGVTGWSQGGIHSWMAALYQMPGVRAVAPLLATPDFAQALAPNGAVRYGLTYEMSLSTVRYAPERDRVKSFIIADQYDSVMAYINARNLTHLLDSVRIPVFQELGWADYLFPVNGGIEAAASLSARNVPIRSYYGTNGHGEPIDNQEMSFELDQTVQWFDHWLRELPLTQDSLPLVFYADDRPGWPHHVTLTWPPEPYQTVRLFLTTAGLATEPPMTDADLSFALAYDQTYTPEMGWDDAYGGTRFGSAFSSLPTRLVSEPLQDSVEITGIPRGLLHVRSNATQFQAHVHLYDVDQTDWKLISRASYGIRGNAINETKDISFEASALSHIVPAGHSLGMEITSLDTLRQDQANTVPFFVSSQSEVLSTSQSPSYVDIPVVGTGFVTAIAEARQQPGPGFRLEQNYPNPFNPVTRIKYTIGGDRGEGVGNRDMGAGDWSGSARGGAATLGPAGAGPEGLGARKTKLVVYDILGRQVATLVNEPKMPGNYEVSFDASGLASGMYIYRLSAGSSVQARTMILIK